MDTLVEGSSLSGFVVMGRLRSASGCGGGEGCLSLLLMGPEGPPRGCSGRTLLVSREPSPSDWRLSAPRSCSRWPWPGWRSACLSPPVPPRPVGSEGAGAGLCAAASAVWPSCLRRGPRTVPGCPTAPPPSAPGASPPPPRSPPDAAGASLGLLCPRASLAYRAALRLGRCAASSTQSRAKGQPQTAPASPGGGGGEEEAGGRGRGRMRRSPWLRRAGGPRAVRWSERLCGTSRGLRRPGAAALTPPSLSKALSSHPLRKLPPPEKQHGRGPILPGKMAGGGGVKKPLPRRTEGAGEGRTRWQIPEHCRCGAGYLAGPREYTPPHPTPPHFSRSILPCCKAAVGPLPGGGQAHFIRLLGHPAFPGFI